MNDYYLKGQMMTRIMPLFAVWVTISRGPWCALTVPPRRRPPQSQSRWDWWLCQTKNRIHEYSCWIYCIFTCSNDLTFQAQSSSLSRCGVMIRSSTALVFPSSVSRTIVPSYNREEWVILMHIILSLLKKVEWPLRDGYENIRCCTSWEKIEGWSNARIARPDNPFIRRQAQDTARKII